MKAILIMSSAVLMLAACSAKVEGGGSPAAAPAPQPFENKLAGPAIDGHWVSGCEPTGTGQSMILDFTVTGQNIVRKTDVFDDRVCRTKLASKSVKREGLFRYESDLGGGIYQLEYRFNFSSNGVSGTYTQYEEIKLEGARLYVNDGPSGVLGVPNIRLDRVGNAK